MCGLAGILLKAGHRTDPAVLRRMANALAPRGPDDEGVYIHQNLGLVHRRLAIIDPQTGHQPMVSEDGRFILVFNGTIYNYVELRCELTALGHRFNTQSDTEVLLHAFQQWGAECQARLNGMWAFAIYDNRDESLFLSRDRCGEKPLYYADSSDGFLFSSEAKGILATGCSTAPDTDVLGLYLTMGFVPAPYSFFKGIRKLRPGHSIEVDKKGNCVERCYWALPEVSDANKVRDRPYVVGEFERLLRESVALRLRADVPYGAFLSGGLDSTAIVTLMRDAGIDPLSTFTIAFEEAAYDESRISGRTARLLGTKHYVTPLRSVGLDESLDMVIDRFDEPYGDSSAIASWHVAHLASKNVKMVLSGDGGDETLSGYNGYQTEKALRYLNHIPYSLLASIAGVFSITSRALTGELAFLIARLSSLLRTANWSLSDRILTKIARTDMATIAALVASVDRHSVDCREYLASVLGTGKEDPFYGLMKFHFNVTLPDQMLTKVDRTSMGHGLEVRAPFLDYRLVEFMACVHRDVKMKRFQRKTVLLEGIGRRLPPHVVRARKRGFSVPLRVWFAKAEQMQLLKQLKKNTIGFEQRVLDDVIDNARRGQADFGSFVWQLLVLDRWFKRYA